MHLFACGVVRWGASGIALACGQNRPAPYESDVKVNPPRRAAANKLYRGGLLVAHAREGREGHHADNEEENSGMRAQKGAKGSILVPSPKRECRNGLKSTRALPLVISSDINSPAPGPMPKPCPDSPVRM